MPDFYEWLADGKDVGTHKKPSKDWVEKVLANPNSPDLFKLVKPGRGPGQLGTDPAGSSLQDVISFGFGRSDGTSKDVRREKAVAHKDFCLLEASVNHKKGVWFNNNLRPNRLTGNKKNLLIDEARHKIRLVSIEITPHPPTLSSTSSSRENRQPRRAGTWRRAWPTKTRFGTNG